MTIRRTGWAIALMIFTLDSASEKVIMYLPLQIANRLPLCQLTNSLSRQIVLFLVSFLGVYCVFQATLSVVMTRSHR
jgi:hypothetical protein